MHRWPPPSTVLGGASTEMPHNGACTGQGENPLTFLMEASGKLHQGGHVSKACLKK